MGNLIEVINQIWEWVKEIIINFKIEDLIIKIIPIIIAIPLIIYSKTIGNKTEAQRRRKAKKK